jgi:hypothetical protein
VSLPLPSLWGRPLTAGEESIEAVADNSVINSAGAELGLARMLQNACMSRLLEANLDTSAMACMA